VSALPAAAHEWGERGLRAAAPRAYLKDPTWRNSSPLEALGAAARGWQPPPGRSTPAARLRRAAPGAGARRRLLLTAVGPVESMCACGRASVLCSAPPGGLCCTNGTRSTLARHIRPWPVCSCVLSRIPSSPSGPLAPFSTQRVKNADSHARALISSEGETRNAATDAVRRSIGPTVGRGRRHPTAVPATGQESSRHLD